MLCLHVLQVSLGVHQHGDAPADVSRTDMAGTTGGSGYPGVDAAPMGARQSLWHLHLRHAPAVALGSGGRGTPLWEESYFAPGDTLASIGPYSGKIVGD